MLDSRKGHVRPMRVLLLSVLLQVGCRQADIAICDVTDPDGRVVQVTREDIQGAQRWDVVEVWRTSGLDGGAEMTMPTSARVSDDGVLAIPDFAVSAVWLIGADGKWLEPVARSGQGPGELLNPLATAWTREGDLLVLDAVQSKVERYGFGTGDSRSLRLPADLLGPVVNSGEVGWFGLRGDGVAFAELPSSPAGGDLRVARFGRAAPGDESRTILVESEYPPDRTPAYDRPSLPEWPRAVLAVGVDRWAVAERSDRYEFIVYGPSDAPALHVCVADAEPFGRGGPEDHEVPAEVAASLDELVMSETVALFSRARLDRDGRLWVERELPQVGSMADGLYGVAGAHLDVISASGEFLARVKLPAGLRFQDARGDTLWAFSIGEFDEVDVVAAEIRPRAP
jgi:hypothetical protein